MNKKKGNFVYSLQDTIKEREKNELNTAKQQKAAQKYIYNPTRKQSRNKKTGKRENFTLKEVKLKEKKTDEEKGTQYE